MLVMVKFGQKNEYLKKFQLRKPLKMYEYLINFIEVIDNQKLFAIILLNFKTYFPKQQDDNKPEDKNTEDGSRRRCQSAAK